MSIAPVLSSPEFSNAFMNIDRGLVVLSDNLDVLAQLPDEAVDVIYIDPPFNTGKRQVLHSIKTVEDKDGDRTGFQGRRYRTVSVGKSSYLDIHDDYLEFIRPRFEQFRRVLKQHGSLYFHIDYREVHYCKVLLDSIFGRECFINEIIWAYDYGARTKRKWSTKHDNILVYVKHSTEYFFDSDAVDRIRYMAPDLVGAEKAAKGKTPTDTWWHTIVPTNGKERTGYPTQKPIGIVRRIVQASCPEQGLVADFFAGSGTTGAAAYELGRKFLSVDENLSAIEVQRQRFANYLGITYLNPQHR